MGDDSAGMAALGAAAASDHGTDRYASWPRARALWLLVALIAVLVASALVPINAGTSTIKTKGFAENIAGNVAGQKSAERTRDEDLVLYDRAVERIARGENYYDFIVEEQRRANYPVTPGLAVRLPTLAYVNAAIGETGQAVAAFALMIGVLAAWWLRLGQEPGGRRVRIWAMAFLFVGASLGVNRYFFQLHELWAGMLLALSFGLHRPGRWGWSLLAAAAALAIREHALAFVLLMAAMAFWRRDWREGAAWSALAAVFLVALSAHLHIIAEQVLPSDRPSPSWLVFRGLSGWLSNIVLSSNLRFLPHWIAGPLVMLMILGWSGWKSQAGAFATLFYLGYGLLFMIAGRGDNFYWGVAVAPAMFIGLAFAPRALLSLWAAARQHRPAGNPI